jgi:hypothetical protein
MRMLCALLLLLATGAAAQGEANLPWIKVSADQRGFVQAPQGGSFRPHGFNYDRDDAGRLLEDYWIDEWETVAADFREMKELGANVVRVHLQFGRFMETIDRPQEESLAQLEKLIRHADALGLYLNVTGLGCYHKADVPAWYDALDEAERWRAQANFWRAVAKVCQDHPAVFCYNLMNEPVVAGGKRAAGEWLGPSFAGKHFVQFITLDAAGRPRPEVAEAWIGHLVEAIREVDDRHLITVGLVHWSLDRPGLTSGFVPDKCCAKLDFIAVHLYPEKGKVDQALKTLDGFRVGKPVVVEETFPLKCSLEEMDEFMAIGDELVAGWISFYWGKSPEELAKSDKLGDIILKDWLARFQKRAPR